MGVYKAAVVTDAGQSLIASAISSGTAVIFSSAKTSSYAYPAGTNIAGLTDLQDIVQTVDPTSAQVFNDTMIQVSSRFDNSDVQRAYLIQTLGLYSQLGTDAPVLFAVIQATTPDQMEASGGVSLSAIIFNVQITVQQASQITVTVNPAGTATVQDILNLQNDIEAVKKKIVPRNISLLAADWSDTYPYTQTVTVDGITADSNLKVIGVYVPDGSTADQVKARNKAAGFLMSNEDATGDGTVTFYAYKKPSVDFTVIVEGG